MEEHNYSVMTRKSNEQQNDNEQPNMMMKVQKKKKAVDELLIWNKQTKIEYKSLILHNR